MQKRSKKQAALNPRLSVRDEDGELTKVFINIGAKTGAKTHLITNGVRYAAHFTAGALRQEPRPMNWDDCTLDELRTLAVYGYDHLTRAEAVKQIEAHYTTDVTTCETCGLPLVSDVINNTGDVAKDFGPLYCPACEVKKLRAYVAKLEGVR